jgi:FAD-dependent urate hydroxylase
MSSMPRILIVGAGIGGLTLAAALDDYDLSIDIVERADCFDPVGAGIALHPNGMSALHELGLAEEVVARGAKILYLELVRGTTVLPIRLAQVWPGAIQPSAALHRADLHDMLVCRVLSRHDEHLRLFMGRTVARIESSEPQVVTRFSDGATEAYDLLVGADGVGSDVRRALFPDSAAQNLGVLYWRFCAANTIQLPAYMWRTVERSGVSFGFIPLGQDKIHCFIQIVLRGDRPYPPNGEREYLDTTLASLDPTLADAIAAMTGPLHVGPASAVRPHRWRHGRCVLLGDAAHAFSPTFSQGGSLAIEDALVLARSLRDTPRLDEALDRYEVARADRVAWAARMANSQVNALRSGRPRHQGNISVASEHLRLMYRPLLCNPLVDFA